MEKVDLTGHLVILAVFALFYLYMLKDAPWAQKGTILGVLAVALLLATLFYGAPDIEECHRWKFGC